MSNSTDPVCVQCGIFGSVKFRHCTICRKVVCVDCLEDAICDTCKFKIEQYKLGEPERQRKKQKKARKRKFSVGLLLILIGFINFLFYNAWKDYGSTLIGFIMFLSLVVGGIIFLLTLLFWFD